MYKRHACHLLRAQSHLGVVAMFICLCELNTTEDLYRAMARGSGAEASFFEIGQSLARMLDGRNCEEALYPCAQKKCRMMRAIKDSLSWSEEKKHFFLKACTQRAKTTLIYRIIKYLTRSGNPIHQGYIEYRAMKPLEIWSAQKELKDLSMCADGLQGVEMPEALKSLSVSANTIWSELLEKKQATPRGRVFLLSKKEKRAKKRAKTSSFQAYLEKDTMQMYEAINARYYMFLNKENSTPFEFLNTLKDTYQTENKQSCFYNFRVKKK
ncbi:hypothetical protein NEAUS04_0502 [Nematocida ausubeli]|uniref:Uncharacterized protein n=1 Tax=Nematocida ausubeli (strain ATCC PRA-371 / ERTm2) TaxID=1913371 RepID=A0A086IZ75_NEMA1|nr:uncharacterized protein NESG_02413 [Nematocida ausubeli]KAI5138060.1 hypothetical protein NEAUS07_2238 [Nematocida ausubeli]KAI5147327.1 hypothetical protein NEAUS05_0638 [Nematocida ausubeli]KAI5161412.1 hypothetical protein NEAUS04_0502 [Nematocida ausubeli]KFG25193.1 hypothetical protein NESG_02413 [Nematocida ausubeli]